ncbi:MAG: response regulator transcription factor [Firmicutes bacterium]|nr:response regulator transcription factor [Bacillota bacterium]
MERILLVEDDVQIVSGLMEFLQGEGFWVDSANGQRQALRKIEQGGYDLLLVDISLADGNGYAVCAAAKAAGDMAVIFLTASADEYSTVAGLDMGADDYISKPFRPRELVSRIRSVLRRAGKSNSALEYNGLQVDPVRGKVVSPKGEILLSALEYRLLLTFFQHKGAVLTRSQLLEEIWDVAGEFVNDNTLTVYIKRLREKIEQDPGNPCYIRTIRGLGYKLGE